MRIRLRLLVCLALCCFASPGLCGVEWPRADMVDTLSRARSVARRARARERIASAQGAGAARAADLRPKAPATTISRYAPTSAPAPRELPYRDLGLPVILSSLVRPEFPAGNIDQSIPRTWALGILGLLNRHTGHGPGGAGGVAFVPSAPSASSARVDITAPRVCAGPPTLRRATGRVDIWLRRRWAMVLDAPV